MDVNNCGDVGDTPNILSGLVTVEGNNNNNGYDDCDGNKGKGEFTDAELGGLEIQDSDLNIAHSGWRIMRSTRVRLAHFSIQENLKSKRILQSQATAFHLESARAHRSPVQSCLTYIIHYSRSNDKTSTERDLTLFPLLTYAAQSWSYHSSVQDPANFCREMSLLSSEETKNDCSLCCGG